ncbi:hypothetical protein GCM10022408_21490 [Hymenobacter fastidiosus]|uniref:Uncharacterized protein n=1 Tax=Hymenobacter fastidiosus TaxID=486264 RepID=A0ABP7SAI3_9BACT
MRIYVVYLLAALLSFYMVMLYYGVSAGFASPFPVLALVGSLVLSAMAAPTLVYHARVGLWLGALGCGLLLPYSVMFLGNVVMEWRWVWLMPLGLLPGGLVLVSSYCTARAWIQPATCLLRFPVHRWLKRCLVLLPLLLWGSYLISIRTAFN